MKQQDYYEVLGVSRDATFEEIVEAYREMIQSFTPTFTQPRWVFAYPRTRVSSAT